MDAGFANPRGVWDAVSRRIGSRHEVGHAVHWRKKPAGPERGGRFRRRAAAHAPVSNAILHDVSVSGARLLVPADDGLIRGSLFDLEVSGAWSTVKVAWVTPSDDPAANWCGVMFLLPDQQFMAAIGTLMGPTATLKANSRAFGGT
jgi:hypothetical protein